MSAIWAFKYYSEISNEPKKNTRIEAFSRKIQIHKNLIYLS